MGSGVTLIPEIAAGPASAIARSGDRAHSRNRCRSAICLVWRRKKMRHDECVEVAKIIRAMAGVVCN
jgi:LysR family hydrogen peroxide-inducible transcriptional activator